MMGVFSGKKDVEVEGTPDAEPVAEVPVADGGLNNEGLANDELSNEAEVQPRRSRLLVAMLALTLVAAVFLAASATLWWRADHDSSRGLTRARDIVLVSAKRDVEVLNTLDYQKVPAGLTQWKAVSTGALNDQLGKIDDTTSQQLVDAGKNSTGKVVDMALTDLDTAKGTASAIAAVQISVKDQSGATQVKLNRFTVSLVDVKGRWLVSALDPLAVSTP